MADEAKQSVKKEENMSADAVTKESGHKESKKTNLIITFVFLLIILPLLLLVIRSNRVSTELQQTKLQIGDQMISKGTYGEAYAYFADTAEGDVDEQVTKDFIKEVYAEHYVLKQEYMRLGYSQEQLETEASEVTEGFTEEMPESLKQVYKEVVVMKRVIYPTIGLKIRSGTMVYLSAQTPQEEAARAEFDQFMTQQLQAFQNTIGEGFNSATKSNYLNEEAVRERSEFTLEVQDFTDMKPTLPLIVHDDFVQKVFSTNEKAVSDIFKAELRDKLYYGVVYVTKAQEGAYNDYKEWLQEKMSAVQIKES